MSKATTCRRCGEVGPVAFHITGNDRVWVCANQHKMTQEPIGVAPFEHRRMSNWISRMQRSQITEIVLY